MDCISKETLITNQEASNWQVNVQFLEMNKAPPLSVLPTCDCHRIAHILKNCFTLYITLLSFSLNVKWLLFWYSKCYATLWDRHCYLQHKEVLAEKSVSNRSNLSLRGICCASYRKLHFTSPNCRKMYFVLPCDQHFCVFATYVIACTFFSAAKFLWLCKNVESLIDSDTLLLKRSQTYW